MATRVQVNSRVDKKLYHKFKMHCLSKERSVADYIEEMMRREIA